jgi:hypothetical protein
MRLVGWCIAKRCALFGLDAPKKSKLSGPGGKPLRSETELTRDITTDLAPYCDAFPQFARSGLAGGGEVPSDGSL